MRRLADKVAIVTGASSGIGRGCALAMAEAGAKVIVTGRNVDRGRITVDMIEELGGESIFVQQDVTRQADWYQRRNLIHLWIMRRLKKLIRCLAMVVLSPLMTAWI